MLVTFSTQPHANVTMFGNIAVELLKLMGHSGKVPSAFYAEDVPSALSKLQLAIDNLKQNQDAESTDDGDGDNDEDEAVSLPTRALPLISLLNAAVKANTNVMWE